ncbi:MAG TPA: pitrilysin family protein [Candidatus Baltobacteraceae bacterium]|nr:pitrilysin family protein [Candidatus Baltobacteraceae bacterium]
MKNMIRIACAAALAIGVGIFAQAPADAQLLGVTRAALKNGLQVVVIHDPLAPVVTSELVYKVGSNEQQFPGEAHALEHMMFRGTKNVSSAQIYEIGQLLGGDYDADTRRTSTQYYFTVPAQYLDVALRLEADRARNLLLTQKGWEAERGAIEQEVTQDDSSPFQKLEERTVLPAIFAGTPYAKDTLGTQDSFQNKITAGTLRKFYETWYRPNNAVLVIAGNVDPAQTLRSVHTYFDGIPAKKVPAKPVVHPKALKPATYRVTTDYPVTIAAMALQTPGWSDKDYAAVQVLEAVLDNQRADLYGLVAAGKAFASGFVDVQAEPHATASLLYGVIPASTKPEDFMAQLQAVVAAYQKSGVPADLVEVAKRRALADKEFANNSISGIASAWSDAIGMMGQQSPDQQIAAIQRVTLADVNRVLRKYVDPKHAILVYATPNNSGKTSIGSPQTKEQNAVPPSKSEPLPAWAQAAFSHVSVPAQTLSPVSMTLSNGMHLIVQPEHVSHTVVVHGQVDTSEAIQAPAAKLGVEDIVNGLFPFGTAQYDRLQLRQQLDAIAAEMQAGTSFSLSVLSSQFDRGVRLLADDELHPAFPAQAFGIVKMQEVQGLTGEEKTPQHLSDVALAKALYPANDPQNAFASPQTAEAVTADDVKAYYEKAFRPDETTVVVIGDVTPQHARSVFEKYFGAWKASGPKPDLFLPAIARNKAASVQVPDPSRVQSAVQLAQVMDLKRSDPQWAQVQVANAVLGANGAFGTLLMDDLRTTGGLAYYAYSSMQSHKNRTTFMIQYASDPGKVNAAEQMALRDVRIMRSGKIDPARLQRGKTMLISDIPLRQQSFDGIANGFLTYAGEGLPLDQATIDARRELSASAKSVQSAFSKWIDPNAFVRVVLGPPSK